MDQMSDVYVSRSGQASAIRRRRDPVVYSRDVSPGEHALSARQLAGYRRNGFVLLKHFFTSDEAEMLLVEAQRMVTDEALRQREEAIAEPGSDAVRSVFRVHQLSALYGRLAADARLLDIACQILGDAVYIHQSRLNLKPGFDGKEFYWHSDFETWHVEDGMPRMRAVSCIILLTDNNEFNGPLMLIPGSHRHYVVCTGETPEDHYKSSLKQQDIGVPDHDSLSFLVQKGGIRAPKGPAGSVVFFDCNTMHGSGSNISPFPRSNLFFVYNAVSNALQLPPSGLKPRPEFIATRGDFTPLRRQTGPLQTAGR
jgi:ectoine hydroxylase